MSYLALARKWRPKTFDHLLGQDHVSKALSNALKLQRLHHAFLFTGTRGVGKTSIARILARSLNCETGITNQPCLQCSTCIAIDNSAFTDLIEIDAASKTRVEDTREMLDNVQYAPTNARFKVYLIDEVHMLSQHSFNALLKTLEEPPSHVKFILATTDPQKLPATVLSRCLQFHLRPLPGSIIIQQLSTILRNENLEFEQDALDILAKAANGSMRDALSLLDQCIASSENKLLSSDIKKILGYSQQDYAIQILNALSEKSSTDLFTITKHILEEGGPFQYVLEELLNQLHEIALCQSIGEHSSLLQISNTAQNLANNFTPEDIQLFYQIALKGQEEIQLAPNLHVGFNMTLLRMLLFRPATKDSNSTLEMTQPTINLKESPILEKNKFSTFEQTVPTPVTSTSIIKNQSTESLKIENPSWSQVVPALKLSGLALNAIENTELIRKEDRQIELRVDKGHLSLFTPTIKTRIESALSDFYQSSVIINLNTDQAVESTPAQEKEAFIIAEKNEALDLIAKDPMAQIIKNEFSAELIQDSVVLNKDEL